MVKDTTMIMDAIIAQIDHPARYVDAGFSLDCLCIKLTLIAQNAHPRRKRFGGMPPTVLIIWVISRTEGGLTICKVNWFTGGARANNL